MTRKADKPTKVQSAVYKNIRWDFSEVADELEELRLKFAPDTKHDPRTPLDWVLRAAPFTLALERMDGTDEQNKPAGYYLIKRAFKACGIVTDVAIADLARYHNHDSSTVCTWDAEYMLANTIQQRLFPALCDAYCTARKQNPNYLSATFGLENAYYVNDTPRDESDKRNMQAYADLARVGIESEVLWLLLCGGLDSHPDILHDTYTATRAGYRRIVTLYASMLLDGDELGDLAHVAAALVAQHIAAHRPTTVAEHDNICLSSKGGKLDFTADRFNPDINDGMVPLHSATTSKELDGKGAAILRAALRYAPTGILRSLECDLSAELERRSKIGGWYTPSLHAETEPTDEDEPCE